MTFMQNPQGSFFNSLTRIPAVEKFESSNLSVDKPLSKVLTIAGSDSGGGAGIQADLKAISATKSYGASVITALTAQNTLGVQGVLPISADFVSIQLKSVFDDIAFDAIKIGMLSDTQVIQAVQKSLTNYLKESQKPCHVVLDPVMVATSGDVLLAENAVQSLIDSLFGLADLITPNLPEACVLTKQALPKTDDEMLKMIDSLRRLPTKAVLLKGGHLSASKQSLDLLITKNEVHAFSADRIHTDNTHGTGCSLSSAIASYLAQGLSLKEAIIEAKTYLTHALAHADRLQLGHGHGPVHHFFNL